MTQLLVDRITVDEPVGSAAACAQVQPTAPGRAASTRPLPSRRLRPRRPGRGSGRTASPTLRPAGFWPTPAAAGRPRTHGRSCVVPPPQAAAATVSEPTWQLTDRGIAVLLVAGLMIMVAALTVVGLTAITVTGEGYRASVSAGLPR
jgi:hypothetical protein